MGSLTTKKGPKVVSLDLALHFLVLTLGLKMGVNRMIQSLPSINAFCDCGRRVRLCSLITLSLELLKSLSPSPTNFGNCKVFLNLIFQYIRFVKFIKNLVVSIKL